MRDDLQGHRAAAGHRPTIGLSVAHLNARILKKFSEIPALILSNAFDIFAVSETWLNANTLLKNHCKFTVKSTGSLDAKKVL